VFYNGHSALNGFGYMRDGTGINLGKRAILHGGQTVADSATNITFDAEVISAFYTGGTFNFFINGVAEVVTPPTGGMAPPAVTGGVNFRIGGANSTEIWKGFISEIIIFDGALKTNDRKDIEKYLGRKYGIKVQ
jgi:hypothetical protein